MNDVEFAQLIDDKIATQAKEAAAEGGDLIVAAMTVKSEIEHRHGVQLSGSAFAGLLEDIRLIVDGGTEAIRKALPIDRTTHKDKRAEIAKAIDGQLSAQRRGFIGQAAAMILSRVDLAMKEADRNAARKLAKQR